MKMMVIVLCIGLLAGCQGQPRYSDDPEASKIQALTDFCIGYGALRDLATDFLVVDQARTTPRAPESLVLGYGQARTFITPYCSPDFDPQSEAFSLPALKKELQKIRLLLLQQEEAQS